MLRYLYIGLSVLLSFGAACTGPNPDYCDEERPCDPESNKPVCDLDGSIAGAANTCVAMPDTVDGGSGSDASTECSDNNSCTKNDKLVAGACVGEVIADAMPCEGEAGSCQSGSCVNQCTSEDAETSCDDNNPCTIDTCQSSQCTHALLANGTGCGDGNCGACMEGICAAKAEACTGNCDTCSGTGTTFNCQLTQRLCTGNCDVCSGSGTNYSCSSDNSLCAGNCDVCSGSGTRYNCFPDTSLCTGNCDVCSGSGTNYSCAASNGQCTGNCDVCSGSGTSFSCAPLSSTCTGACGVCSGNGNGFSCRGNQSACPGPPICLPRPANSNTNYTCQTNS